MSRARPAGLMSCPPQAAPRGCVNTARPTTLQKAPCKLCRPTQDGLPHVLIHVHLRVSGQLPYHLGLPGREHTQVAQWSAPEGAGTEDPRWQAPKEFHFPALYCPTIGSCLTCVDTLKKHILPGSVAQW